MKKITKKIVVILCLILILLNGGASTVSAATYTVEEASQALANYAISVAESSTISLHWYDVQNTGNGYISSEERTLAYSYTIHDGPYDGKYCDDGCTYGVDCVGWVSFAVHNCLGIGNDEYETFIAPPGSDRTYYDYTSASGYSSIADDLIPGDILISSTHVMIYVGNGNIVHSAYSDHLGYDALADTRYYSQITGYARLNSTALEAITSINEEYLSATTGSSSSSTTSSGVPLSNFYFNGIPDGEYSIASTNLLSAIIDTLAQVADYIIGILTFGPRVVIVGWTALVDQLVTSFVNSLVGNGEVDESGISSVEIDSASSSDRVTIENLVYNLYAPLDINIFK